MDLKSNLLFQLRKREAIDGSSRSVRENIHVTLGMIERLGLAAELQGHTGCVNCLEWNTNGSIIASASDDVQVMLWDPHRQKLLQTIPTGHQGNIFSVKFLPNTCDNTIVTGAADFRIRVHNVVLKETTHECSCHMNRVKRIATDPTNPSMFWSASEDGTIMQYDLRTPHTCNGGSGGCVLINLMNHIGQGAEAKCLAINPTRPELLVVGANDPYARLYDRRMIKPATVQYPDNAIPRTTWERHFFLCTRAGGGDADNNIPRGCVKYFVPGHLPSKTNDANMRSLRGMASTYVTFSADGNDLLVNLGGEQIYLYNIYSSRQPLEFQRAFSSIHAKSIECNGQNEEFQNQKLPLRIEKVKQSANAAFEKKLFSNAVNLYNDSIANYQSSALLYGNRAAALMKRAWEGDTYAALRDCASSLTLDRNYMKAHFRFARCLLELQRPKEAQDCLSLFKTRYPEHANSHSYRALEKDIHEAVSSLNSSDNEKKGTENGSDEENRTTVGISDLEEVWRGEATDYDLRFCGHCNTTTDIKEANFFGSDGQFIVAGSDDGSFFIWSRRTGNIVRVLRGDDSIVNCLQPHPYTCLLATSGIDPVVRLWSPQREDMSNDREVTDPIYAATMNQKRMRADPFEAMLMNMGYRVGAGDNDDAVDPADSRGQIDISSINCRTS